MKTAILATLIASAAAFAPAKQAARSTAVKAFEDELGAQPPLGFFDPLGLVADGNEANFDRLRFVEIKHVPSGFAAVGALPGAGLVQLFAFIGFLEIFVMKDITGGEFVGDFRNDFIDYGWAKLDDETQLKKRAIELNQGRAAQMGILALMVHEKLGVSLIPGQ
jgi:hypothetical protein